MNIDIASFDCYGTLVDWEGGVASFLYELALRSQDPWPPPGGELRKRWEAIQFELIRGSYRPYKQVLAESLRRFGAEFGYPVADADEQGLARSMRSWQPFPDTVPALRKAQQTGIKLVIVSNTDRDLIAHTLRQIDLQFDEVITAEDCGAYKPADTVFGDLLTKVGVSPDRILHVAFGFDYDISPAKRAGMRTAWINRHAQPSPPSNEASDYEWRDLWGLVGRVGADPGVAARTDSIS